MRFEYFCKIDDYNCSNDLSSFYSDNPIKSNICYNICDPLQIFNRVSCSLSQFQFEILGIALSNTFKVDTAFNLKYTLVVLPTVVDLPSFAS